jgi:hypothetical protein
MFAGWLRRFRAGPPTIGEVEDIDTGSPSGFVVVLSGPVSAPSMSFRRSGGCDARSCG